jgi:lysophospholipase L1-like esterase
LGIACLFGLFAAEGLVRAAAPQLTYRFPRGLFVNDKSVAYRLEPGFSGALETPEYTTAVEITSQGLRDDREYGPKAAGERRVLILGDSFVMGVGVEIEETFVEQIEASLGAGAPVAPVRIVNTGVAGYSTRQELAFLESYGQQFAADAVLLGFFVGNDLAENAGTALQVDDGYLVDAAEPEGMLPGGLRRFLGVHSQLYHLLWPLQRRMRGYGHETSEAAHYVAEPYVTDDGQAAALWQPTREALESLIGACRKAGLPLAVLLIPDYAQVVPSAWARLMAAAGPEKGRYEADAPNRRLVQFLESENVPVLDLLPAFRAEPDPKGLYLSLDRHWTVRGHEVASRAAAPFISRWLETTPASAARLAERAEPTVRTR